MKHSEDLLEEEMLGDSDILDCLSGLVSPFEQQDCLQEENKEYLKTKNKR